MFVFRVSTSESGLTFISFRSADGVSLVVENILDLYSPCAVAGVKAGDCLVAVNGNSVLPSPLKGVKVGIFFPRLTPSLSQDN